ncbi:MAG: tetrahydrofolate dehydrogenase/cyclohydrolase catalytic domain-containing protein, partial [Thermoplasmata archaeon]|nr:tetrahydrofolate dehydrogenase/cyclohydrolase catalytic domain-containing protein [Thermoplasmata archaeon]
MADVLDGRDLAHAIQGEVATAVQRMSRGGADLTLVSLQVGDDPGTRAYGRVLGRACKEVGMRFEARGLPAGISLDELTASIRALNEDPQVHGILVH